MKDLKQKEKLNKQLQGIRDRRSRREVIKNIVAIFQNVKSFKKFKREAVIGEDTLQTFENSKQ